VPPTDIPGILDALPVAVLRLNQDLRVTYANHRIAELLGTTTELLVGQTPTELGMTPDVWGPWEEAARAALTSGTETRTEYLCRSAGRERFVQFRFVPDPTDPSFVLAVALVNDEVHSLRAALADTTQRFDAFMDAMPVIAWLRDSTDRYVYVNPAYLKVSHGTADDWVGKHPAEVWPAEVAEQFLANDRRAAEGGAVVEVHESAVAPDGTHRTWMNVKFSYQDAAGERYYGGVGVDVTDRLRIEQERRTLERQLYQAQKLESLGVMAGGVAHDFNNLLTAIIGNIALAKLQPAAAGPIADYLHRVETAAVRAAELCQQMLAYTGRGHLVVRDLDLNELCREMSQLFGTVISKKAVVKYSLADNLPTVRGDPTQLRQVLLNLVTNAADAIDVTSGVITVTTGTLVADSKYLDELSLSKHLTPGLYVTLEVSDTGGGMDEGTKAKLFEPFFTTKFTGRGLGLAAVQGIVRGHRGAIKVYTQMGKGSTFKVLLPASGVALPVAAPDALASRAGRGRTILVVDDEEAIRTLTGKILERAGFNTLTAGDGVEGVNVFRDFHPQIAAVLLDLTMPKLSGGDVFRELRRIRGDVKVILTSGYGRQEATTGFEGKGLAGFVRKPFRAEELLDMLFRTLDG
jgi:PAS domain S-box-containing protein